MIGKIVKEMKWVMGTNESAQTKGKCCHGKEFSPMMSNVLQSPLDRSFLVSGYLSGKYHALSIM